MNKKVVRIDISGMSFKEVEFHLSMSPEQLRKHLLTELRRKIAPIDYLDEEFKKLEPK